MSLLEELETTASGIERRLRHLEVTASALLETVEEIASRASDADWSLRSAQDRAAALAQRDDDSRSGR